MKTALACIVLATSISTFAAPSVTAEWPDFRGPARDGISTEKGLLASWPEGGPKLLWQASGLGKGYASVAIVGGRIFTTGAKKGGQWLTCLDLATRAEKWTLKIGDGGGEANSTPVVSDGLVYALDRHGHIVCADAATGAEKWRKDFGADLGGKMMSGWGYAETPLVDGDRLVVTPGGESALIAALDKKTGKIVWQTVAGDDVLGGRGQAGAGYTGPVISNAGGIKHYVQLTGRSVVGVDAASGKLLWSYNRVNNGTANIPTPIVSGDFVFVSTGYGSGAALLKISKSSGASTAAPAKPVDPAVAAKAKELKEKARVLRDEREKFQKGTPEWDVADKIYRPVKEEAAQLAQQIEGNSTTGSIAVPGSPLAVEEQYFLNASTFQNHHGGMIRIGDVIYAGHGHNNGIPIALDWKSGKPLWTGPRHPQGKESAAVLAADGKLIFRYQNGVTALIAPGKDGYEDKGWFKEAVQDGPAWAHPVVYQGNLYLRTHDTLMCYDIKAAR